MKRGAAQNLVAGNLGLTDVFIFPGVDAKKIFDLLYLKYFTEDLLTENKAHQKDDEVFVWGQERMGRKGIRVTNRFDKAVRDRFLNRKTLSAGVDSESGHLVQR